MPLKLKSKDNPLYIKIIKYNLFIYCNEEKTKIWIGKTKIETGGRVSILQNMCVKVSVWGFPGGTSGKEPACQYRRL